MSQIKVGDSDGLPEFAIETDREQFVVSKVLTQKGEKVQIHDTVADATLRLDALALESLSWQPEDESLARLFDLSETAVSVSGPGTETGDELTVSNEYAICVVRKVIVDGDACLEIASESGESASTLSGPALASLAAFENEFVLSEEFRSPFGPERKRQFDAPF